MVSVSSFRWPVIVARVLALGFCALLALPARASGDIVYAARYYLKPNATTAPDASSHYHLYCINADGSGRRQITLGTHDDTLPQWSPDGRHIAFIRDEKTLCLSDAQGRNVTTLREISANSYWETPRWSPDGKTFGVVVEGSVKDKNGKLMSAKALSLIDVKTRAARRIAGVQRFAWSPDGRKLMLQNDDGSARVLAWPRGAETKLPKLPLASFAWLDNSALAAVVTPPEDTYYVRQLLLLNAKGAEMRRFDLPSGENDGAGWGSEVTAISGVSNAFGFVSNERTSSGFEATYFRVARGTGKMTRLAHGQSFAWATGGQRFLNVSYHDTAPYDTLPNGHKRVVYVTKLQAGTVGNPKLRDLVSGLVLVGSADWRAAPER